MKYFHKSFAAISFSTLFAAPPAEAHRHYHHHAGFFSHHHASHSYHRSFAHHVAHYAVSYGVHYEIRRGVRAALAPVDGRRHADAPIESPSATGPTPIHEPATYSRTEYAHAGPRLGINFAPGEMRVAVVDRDSLAYAAGIDPGDLIKTANGAIIHTPEDFAKAIDAAAATGALRLLVERDGKEYNAAILLDGTGRP